MGKSDCLNISTANRVDKRKTAFMDLPSYFELLKYILMSATFLALILAFLHSFLSKEEETS